MSHAASCAAVSSPLSRQPAPPHAAPLVEVYEELFQGIPADSTELLNKSFRLRYQVYCIEHRFEDPEDCPGGLERDGYDDHSAHALLLHRPSQMPVGTIRLVMHRPGADTGCLPFHRVCQDPRAHNPQFLPLETTAELSRLAVSKLSRRQAESKVGAPAGIERRGGDDLQIAPYVALGLMRMGVEMAVANGIEYFCAIMEPSLLRMLTRLGIHFERLGPTVNYHGVRQPCYANIPRLLDGIGAERPDIWEIITDHGRLSPTAPSRITNKLRANAK